MLSSTSTREPARHVCPVAAKMPAMTPLTAWSRSASANTMLGDLPPSSSVAGISRSAAALYTPRPPASAPVKATLATLRCATSGTPTCSPKPVTTFSTPGGKPTSSNTRASAMDEAEVDSDGLSTTVLPAASAGASFHVASMSGEFHGVMAAITPSGSGRL